MIDQFVEMTQRIIQKDGFDGYLPTLVLPDKREVLVLEREFDGDNHESFVYDWISKHVTSGQSFMVAFKVSSTHFKVFGLIDGVPVERVCPASEA